MGRRAIQDALERAIEVEATPLRIVSLVPSVTELLDQLGAGDRLVGISRYCDPLPAHPSLARVGGQKDPDVPAILGLRPDLVLAVFEENLERDVVALATAGVPVYVGDVRTVEAALAFIGEIGEVVDADPSLVAQIAAVAHQGVAAARRIAHQAGTAREPVRVFCPVWRDPWIAVSRDTYLHDVVTCAGGRLVEPVVRGRGDRRYPKVELDAAVATAPELVLLPDEPYRFTDADIAELRPHLPAARIELFCGRTLTWYGRRLADLPKLAEVIAESKGAR